MKKFVSMLLCCTLLVSTVANAVPVRAYESYVHGLLASRAGDIERAISDYKKVIALDDKSSAVYRELTLLYWQSGSHEEAMKAASRYAELNNDSVYTQLFLGSFYIMANETELAKSAWEKALKMDPVNESAILYLAAYHGVSEPEKAIEYWKKYITLQPESAEGYYQMGLVQEKLNNYALARGSFNKALALNAEFGDVYLSLAQLDERDKDITAASEKYEKYLQLDPENYNVLLYLGGLYFRAKRFEDAQRIFERAELKQPNDNNIQFWLGVTAENRKDWAGAIKHFEKLRVKEETPLLLARLSYYYSALKDYKKSVACLERAIKLDPANANTYYLTGLSYMDLKKFSRAEKSFKASIRLRADYAEVHFYLGVLYDERGKFDKAEAEIKKAIALDPKYASALNYLGYTYADRNIKLQESEIFIKMALETDPTNAAYQDSLGWLLFRKGDFDAAEEVLLKASASLEDATILEHLGDVQAKLGKNSLAWEAYGRASSKKPGNKKLAKKIKQLETLVLPATIQRKLLKRAISNVSQIASLRANFVITGQMSDNNYRFVGLLQYARPDNLRADLLGSFMAPQVIIIEKASMMEVFPRALHSSLAAQGKDALGMLSKFFNASLIRKFDTDSTVSARKGGSITYTLDGEQLVIDRANGSVIRYCGTNGVLLSFGKIKWEAGLYLPHRVDILLPQEKISSQIEFKNYHLNETLPLNTFSTDNLQ
jgi:tetratricopeptide (TPR) repeat protein